jgi:hypothetical protein
MSYLSVSGLFTLLTSWSSFTDPAGFGKRVGLLVGGVDGLNEIRAQYGGFFLAVAAVDALALSGIIDRRTGYVVNAAVFGGLILGRLASLMIDRGYQNYGGMISALFFIDSVGCALALAALFLDRRA